MRGLVQSLAGPRGYALAVMLLAAFVILALEPFRFSLPSRVANGAVVDAGGTVRLPAPGLVRTTAPPGWLAGAVEHNRLTVDLRVRTYSVDQYGPARIFTVSRDPLTRNLTVAQDGADLIIRLRTPASTLQGTPAHTIPGVFRSTDWRSVGVAISPGTLAVTVDGRLVRTASLPEASLANWNRRFYLALGNELTGERPWLGEITQALVRAPGQVIDYARDGGVEVPGAYWVGLFWDPPPWDDDFFRTDRRWDLALNLVGFVPLGFVLALARGRRGGFVFAVGVCALVSLGVEAVQVLCPERHASLADWMLNIVGAAVGAWLAPTGERRSVRSPVQSGAGSASAPGGGQVA
jgi:hypothetical protein